MFGTNPIRKATKDPEKLAVQEIFHTIQGEGPYAGMPAVFVRLAGCNLKCHFCDTDFESKINNIMMPWEVISIIQSLVSGTGTALLVLSGGEPLRQDLSVLFDLLNKNLKRIKKVQIETAGTLYQFCLDDYPEDFLTFVCSPKTAILNSRLADHCTNYKYIIKAGEESPEDGLPMYSTQIKDKKQKLFRPDIRLNNIWIQPMDEQDPILNLANQNKCIELAMKYGYRISLQMHKILGVL